MTKTLLLVLTACLPALGQDLSLKLNPSKDKAYSFENYYFPKDMEVRTTDKGKKILEMQGLTLVQVWSVRNGGGPDMWLRVVDLHNRYKDQGLRTVSINFENGSDFQGQFQKWTQFLNANPHPMETYMDFLGYTIDTLRIPGFPAYLLVKGKEVVFTTLGEAEDGVEMLESEIERYLEEMSKK